MTLQKTKNKITVVADGVEDTFSFDFRIDDKDDIVIYYDGIEQDPIPSFTIADSDLGKESGGDIVFDSPPAACDLTIYRRVSYDQQTDYRPYDAFAAETHEKTLDKIIMLIQQQLEKTDRALLADVTSDLTLKLPSPSAGKTIKWNTAEDNFENSTYDPDQAQTDAETARDAAQTAQSNAETAEANAEDWANETPDTVIVSGNEKVTNGTFDSDTSDWSAGNSASLASVSGGQSGNCLEITENGADNPYAYQDLTLEIGEVYILELYVKEGTEPTFSVYIAETDLTHKQYLDRFVTQEATGSWVKHTTFFKATATTMRLVLEQRAASGAGTTMLFDEVNVAPNKYSSKHWAYAALDQFGIIHFSTSDPVDADDGQDGDIWFKYV